jgi:glycine/D-amino acid oxidase-like deaminating enzyme
VIDKGPVGDGSSQRAAAIITGLLWSEAGVLVRKRCLELFAQLSRELDGYSFRQVGCLNLFSRETWQERLPLLPAYDRLGAPYEILNAAEMAQRWAALTPDPELMGLYDPLGGYSEPSEYIPAMKHRLEELGVEICERCPVTGFALHNGRVTGIETAQGLFESDVVICTVYGWTNVLLEAVGISLPVKNFAHQRYVTTPLDAPLDIPAVNANPYSGYFRPALGGRLLAGIETSWREEHPIRSADFHLSELSAPAEAPNLLRENLKPLLPALAATSWESEKVGLITFSIDGEPVLGPVQQIPGLIVGLAFHSGGFAYNPGSGELLAEYACDGKTNIDVSSWSPNRFDSQETREYLATMIRQQDVARRRH